MSYASPAAFRAALENRLNANARTGGPPVSRARKVVAFTRLLARLRRAAPDGWVLKGGFALELRLAGRSRTTRDVDLDFAAGLEAATDALIAAATTDLGDFFEFAVERAGVADVGDAGGGVRFRAEARVAGRAFETLAIDVGVDASEPIVGDELQVPDLLGFAGISSPSIPAAPLERHLAEKLHALTRRYGADQPSSRPKDFDAREPLAADALEEPTPVGGLLKVLRRLLVGGDLAEDLVAVLRPRLLPLRLAGRRVPPSPSPRWFAPATRLRVGIGGAPPRMGDVDPGCLGSSPLRHR